MHRDTPQHSLSVISKLHILPILAYSVLVIFADVSVASAQRITASLVGTTRDSSSAVIPNATVMVTNIGTNVVVKVQTNGDGQFEFLSLPPGPYTAPAMFVTD